MAMSNWNLSAKSGVIYVLRRSDYTDELRERLEVSDVKADQRNSVVHELLHRILGIREESVIQTLERPAESLAAQPEHLPGERIAFHTQGITQVILDL